MTEAVVLSDPQQEIRERPSIWQRFQRHRLAAIGLVIMIVIVFMAIFPGALTIWGPFERDREARDAPPILIYDSANFASRLGQALPDSLAAAVGAVVVYEIVRLMVSRQPKPGWRQLAREGLGVGVGMVVVYSVVSAIAKGFAGHPLGTDRLGYDVWSRLVYSTRVSLSVGLVAVAIYTLIGTIIGGVAGYYGKSIDNVLMRITDTIMSFPTLIILLTVMSLFEQRSLFLIMAVIGLLAWPRIARLVRGQVLSIKAWEFVQAALSLGARSGRIIWAHIMPNVFAHIIVAATFGIASAILTEASLSFLGLGDPNLPSWGKMLNEAQSLNILQSKPWLWLPPGLMIALCVLSVNFIGDGLRDALDPHSQSL